MRALGLHTLEPAEYLGPQAGWNGVGGVDINATKIGVLPFYALAFAIPAAAGGVTGAILAGPKHRLKGTAIGALGAGVGGLTATFILKALSA